MGVFDAVERDLERFPLEYRESALAATALALAARVDNPENSATSVSMCAKALNDTMAELRALCPPVEEADRIDEVGRKRELRRRGAGA